MEPEMLHVTLAFLGDVTASQLSVATAVADGIDGQGFVLTLDRLGYWTHNRIFWAGAASPPLAALSDALASGLRAKRFSIDSRPFVPHVTLLRDARKPGSSGLRATASCSVTEFVLAESQWGPDGARYGIVGRWRLS
jgi:2'-5' RNA ligase